MLINVVYLQISQFIPERIEGGSKRYFPYSKKAQIKNKTTYFLITQENKRVHGLESNVVPVVRAEMHAMKRLLMYFWYSVR